MNKKGFTLIELMGVVVILSLLVMVAVPIVDKYIKQSKSNSAEYQKEALVLAAKNWASDNKTSLPKATDSVTVTLDLLVEMGYLDLDIYSSLSNFEYEGKNLASYDSIKITNNGSKYSYDLIVNETIDDTPPVNLRLRLVSSTANSLTVKAFADDPDSAVVKYEFNIDDEKDYDGGLKWEGGSAAKVYTFKNISEGTHTVIFKATNATSKEAISTKFTFNTKTIARLEFVVEKTRDCNARPVRIIYPAISSQRTYKISNGSLVNVTQSYVDVKYADGSSISNGTNITASAIVENTTVTETYNVKFEKILDDGSTCVCGTTGCN